MKNKALFHGQMTAMASETHPLQSRLRFVFTDYEPNVNKQGVQKSEAANILSTGLNMPVKVHFRGDKVGDHYGTIPVGPIINMYEEDNRIIGDAIVWKEPFGELVEYLEAASQEDGGVQFSWELYYADSFEEDGVQWLKDVTVAAATIVDMPAYQGRTPLLSFASERRELIEEIEQLKGRIAALEVDSAKDQEVPMTQVANAAHVDPIEPADVVPSGLKAGSEHKQEQEGLREPVDTGSATPVATSTDLEAELRDLREFKARIESEARAQELKDNRASKLAEAGVSGVDFTAASFILELEDSAFEQFLAFVQSVRASAAPASASASQENEHAENTDVLPDPITGGNEGYTIAQLAEALRNASRNTAKKEV
jgi:hypothetical protein